MAHSRHVHADHVYSGDLTAPRSPPRSLSQSGLSDAAQKYKYRYVYRLNTQRLHKMLVQIIESLLDRLPLVFPEEHEFYSLEGFGNYMAVYFMVIIIVRISGSLLIAPLRSTAPRFAQIVACVGLISSCVLIGADLYGYTITKMSVWFGTVSFVLWLMTSFWVIFLELQKRWCSFKDLMRNGKDIERGEICEK